MVVNRRRRMFDRKKERGNMWYMKRKALLSQFMTEEMEKPFHKVYVGSE